MQCQRLKPFIIKDRGRRANSLTVRHINDNEMGMKGLLFIKAGSKEKGILHTVHEKEVLNEVNLINIKLRVRKVQFQFLRFIRAEQIIAQVTSHLNTDVPDGY